LHATRSLPLHAPEYAAQQPVAVAAVAEKMKTPL
jgi:hypothetical protein